MAGPFHFAFPDNWVQYVPALSKGKRGYNSAWSHRAIVNVRHAPPEIRTIISEVISIQTLLGANAVPDARRIGGQGVYNGPRQTGLPWYQPCTYTACCSQAFVRWLQLPTSSSRLPSSSWPADSLPQFFQPLEMTNFSNSPSSMHDRSEINCLNSIGGQACLLEPELEPIIYII